MEDYWTKTSGEAQLKGFCREENTQSDYISHFLIGVVKHPTKVI